MGLRALGLTLHDMHEHRGQPGEKEHWNRVRNAHDEVGRARRGEGQEHGQPIPQKVTQAAVDGPS